MISNKNKLEKKNLTDDQAKQALLASQPHWANDLEKSDLGSVILTILVLLAKTAGVFFSVWKEWSGSS